ncbi:MULTISPECIES: hypothetical protein [unclassified Corynebacterium]|uniref:hypothetical protein n=1 Tax=unclassified Corynebacterium TaxID=2624378 RepID=UPI0029C9C296|nr:MULTISPECIES: hypothetical protein [unclassified Corynebacterium]WPF67204.1 hypothetical protein OLX12_05705 [Corynebacterium sp. 22KM0430]WPF69693.1 hypothetical protein OLW90_05700 [Corynebacterium sp. 21KM1197]
MAKRAKYTAALALAGTALLAAGCQSQIPSDLGDDMGNATAVASPPSDNPAGEIISLPGQAAQVQALESVGEVLAVRSADSLSVGTVADFRDNSATTINLAPECGELTATDSAFVVACGQEVRLYPADNPDNEQVRAVEHPATAATVLSSGELVTANDVDSEVVIYPEEGDPTTIGVAAPTTQLLSLPIEGAPDAIVRTWAQDTTIQDVDWANDREGGRLRVGLGVGRISAGSGGLLLASDTTGNQLAVYTTDEVIRLHQTAPVPESPWAVAWDDQHKVAWVASTAGNLLTGWDISQGVPQQRYDLPTIAQATSLVALDSGTLVLASASGEGLQVIPNPTSST